MKPSALLAVAITALVVAIPASATTITLDFSSLLVPPGNGSVDIGGPTTASGSNIGISTLIVTGDGVHDGSYNVTGTVDGFGDLSFDTSTNFIQIVGGVTGLVGDGTTLLAGTGTFTNVVVTDPGPSANPRQPTVSFDASDIKDPTLLSALGISWNQWDLAAFDVSQGTGNNFPQFSADVLNTQVPEPATLGLLGFGVLGLGARLHWRRK